VTAAAIPAMTPAAATAVTAAGARPTTTVEVLGTAIAVPADLAIEFAELPTTSVAAIAQLDPDPTDVALAKLTALAIEHSPLLCLHAGVVAGRDGLIAIPGHSGLGKTTLVAAFVRAGYGYISDESLALSRDSGVATAFARPLALNADVWPIVAADLGDPPPEGTERLVAPADLGWVDARGGRVAHILLARRRPGPAELAPVPRAEGVRVLLAAAFNHYRDPASSFRTVVAVVRAAQVWRAGYENAPDLVATIARTICPPPDRQPDCATSSK
jgi:hypothetical protein